MRTSEEVLKVVSPSLLSIAEGYAVGIPILMLAALSSHVLGALSMVISALVILLLATGTLALKSRKYVVTDRCLRVVKRGEVQDEVPFERVGRVRYYRSSERLNLGNIVIDVLEKSVEDFLLDREKTVPKRSRTLVLENVRNPEELYELIGRLIFRYAKGVVAGEVKREVRELEEEARMAKEELERELAELRKGWERS